MKAVLFDLFGTLAYIDSPTHPYRQLLSKATVPDARNLVLTRALSPARMAKEVGVEMTPQELAAFELEVADEVGRIRLYEDVPAVLDLLRQAGFVILVSSNLAKPYAVVKKQLADKVDYWNFSFDTGLLKPHPGMFTTPAAAFGVQPHHCVVIGDNPKTDGEGAKAAGMRFILLDREGLHPVSTGQADLVQTFDQVLLTTVA